MQYRPALALAAVLCVAACDTAPDWPPFERRLTAFFDTHRGTLEELEREMSADGYRRMDSRILSGSLTHPAAPALDAAQVEKYRRLLEPADAELMILRRPGATEFEFLAEPVDTRLYLFRYVRGPDAAPRPTCRDAMRAAPCGHCAVELAGDWQLEYEWFPQDLDVEARECR